MPIYPPPVRVRIELDHMRHQIVTAFGPMCDELQQTLDREVKNAIDHFDFGTEVRRQATSILGDTIRDAITSALSEFRWDQAMRKTLVKMLAESLTKMAQDEQGENQ